MMSSQHDVRYWDPFHQKNRNKIGDSKTRGWVISRGLAILQTWRDLDTANLLAAGTRVQTSWIKLCVTGYHNLGNATKAAHIKREGHMVNDKGELFVTEYHDLGNSDGAANKATHIKREGHMVNNKGKLCVTGYHNLGNATKAVHVEHEGHMANNKGKLFVTGYHNLGNLDGAANKATHIEREGHMVNNKGKLCVTGYHNLGNATKAAHIEREGHMVNNKGKLFVTGYHNLDNSDRAANKAAHIEREGHMVNDKRKLCVAGYHNLGGLGGAMSTTALIKRDCYMINDKGVRTSTAHNRLGKIGAEARDKIARATVLSEHHSHICISALCQSGASVKWEGQNVRLFHLCYDPEQSGLAGQKPQQVRGLGLHVCKKCHRTARSARRLAAWHQHATATASCYANISTSGLFRK